MNIITADLSASFASVGSTPVLPAEVRGIATIAHATTSPLALPPLPALDSRVLLILRGRGSITTADAWSARFDSADGAATIALPPGAREDGARRGRAQAEERARERRHGTRVRR